MSKPHLTAAPSSRPHRHLPRLEPEWYRGRAVVFWTHTIADRRTGWLTPEFHTVCREILLHAAARERLFCPVYTLMPDHIHLIWIGIGASSDQRHATAFLRTHLKPHLGSARWQHQPHDHVLREEERQRGTFAAIWAYLAENPVRAGLAPAAEAWPFTGCIVPGYPALHPLAHDFPEKFWRIFAAAIERAP